MFSKTRWLFILVAIFKLSSASLEVQEDETTRTAAYSSHELLALQSTTEFSQLLPTSTTLKKKSKKFKRLRPRPRHNKFSRNVETMTAITPPPIGNATTSNKFSFSDIDSNVTFEKRHPLKPITDLIMYGMKKDMIQPRTGLLLFGAITAIEVVVGTTLLFGLSGMAIAALIAMVKFLLAGSVLMMG